ncbi:GNAT family N-acetyltransferase [Pontibacter liquoris]|uniref:GNAT family N-acetyltransferase n=1 Tax=Pontibacter liquoris TaxID=2905677 RepID=UPI001FA805CD|nr:GNAT family N-acetyltransferase [Pontibacter liquoris]
MKHILETERLWLREFNLGDKEFVIALLNSPGWLQFIGDRNVKTDEQAAHYLENGPLKSYRENGYGLYLVEQKADNCAIGMCGIINRNYLDSPDIGFAFLPDFNGKGYAFEIASATMVYAKDTLHLPKIAAITVSENARSIRLIEKIGLTFSKPIHLPGSTEVVWLYTT